MAMLCLLSRDCRILLGVCILASELLRRLERQTRDHHLTSLVCCGAVTLIHGVDVDHGIYLMSNHYLKIGLLFR